MDISDAIGLFFLTFGVAAVMLAWFLWSITHYD